MEANATEPLEHGEDSSPRAIPSRRVAMALTLFFGPGVGHVYLGAIRRALAWGYVPIVLAVGLCVVVVRSRTGLGLLAPAMLLLVLVRLGALFDIFLVPERRLRRLSGWLVLAFTLGVEMCGIAAMLWLRVNVVQAFQITAGSMRPSLLSNDHLFVDMGAFRHGPPKRGDLAVFKYPERPQEDFIKRVIALPGDKIEVRGGEAVINDWPLPHCTVGKNVTLPSSGYIDEGRGTLELEYVDDASFLIFIDEHFVDAGRTWTVAPNELFVLGDNRNNSMDSRAWFHGWGGGVPFENLLGQPLMIWLSFTETGQINWPRLNTRLDVPHLLPSLASFEPALRACLNSRPTNTDPPKAPN
ncbi:MAG TPA: signal peptidase I [Polyangiaceae bacterium]